MPSTDSSLHIQGKPRRRSATKTLLALLLALLLLGIAVDLILGYGLGLGDRVLVQPDPAAGYVFVPNQHVYRFLRHTDINQYSMRSPSITPQKPAGTYRILLVGDSMTYGGTQVGQQEIFASLLAAELPAQLHRPVEVLNASTGAWAIANEAGYLESRGTYDADLVVLVINTGDGIQPPATLADLGGDAATVKSPCALCELWTRYLRDRILHGQPKVDAGTAPSADEMKNVAPNLLRLEHFRQLTEQHHTRMAVIFLAMRQYIPDGATASAPYQLLDWARLHAVPVVDTTAAEGPYPLKQITRDGLHFSARGHRLVATYLEQHWSVLDPVASGLAR